VSDSFEPNIEGRKSAAVLAARLREDQEGWLVALAEFDSPEEMARGFMSAAMALTQLLAAEIGEHPQTTARRLALWFAGMEEP